ncbi:MAG TPA: protease pro-enzyme activation domain-containing protein, partial [Steroidobacteraceae bacterium]|nr:protease pro-enzyme activation domain-containing protein [Steroidobacteraceae bacterium]
FKCFSRLAICALMLLTCGRPAFGAGSQTAPAITAAIDENALITLAGNTRPEARAANDRGAVADDLPMEHMLLQLRRSSDQEQAFEKYLDELEDPKSPNYHHWLSAQEVGARYGLAAQDLAAITDWLKSHGFTVNRVYPNGMVIDFSGNAGEVREAFRTEIHNLEVKGAAHIANMSDPQIPAALAPAVVGVVSLHDFRPRAMNKPRPAYTTSIAGVPYDLVVPADLATIYDFNPLFAAGYSGQGQTIVVLEDTDLYSTSDWTTFRSVLGLASAYPEGSLSQVHPGNCTDPGTNSDNGEEAIDVEWASAAAPSAAIELASCADTGPTFGGFIALQNLLNASGTPPAIISISYGECEAENGAAQNASIISLYQQAVAAGVSVFVAAGDEGAAGCDANATSATHGIGVSGFASTPYNVAVGGTDFGDTYAGTNGTYWSRSNGAAYGSARSYVPEIPWNDSCASKLLANYEGYKRTYGSSGFCNSLFASNNLLLNTVAGSGGPSGCATGTPSSPGVVGGTCKGNTKPSWQSVLGNPSDGVRDIPDVSMFAADGVWSHFYVICWSDPSQYSNGAASCSGAPNTWAGFGGTSFASPIMAAIQALINQKTGSRQGNPNPLYYSFANAEYGTTGNSACNSTRGKGVNVSCTFYNVTQGDIDVTCTGSNNCYRPSGANGVMSTSDSAYHPAYPTASGWNFATGLGTVNAYNLVMESGPTGVPEPLDVKPLAENFGKVKVGKVKRATLTLSNPAKEGPAITFGNPLATISPSSPEFEVTSTCSGQLIPKKKCNVTVKFAPTSTGAVSSSVTISDNAENANQVIQLKGTGE